MGQLNTYLSARGAALTGHCMAEDTATNQHRWSGRIMPYYRQMGIPGIDHLSRRVFGAQTGKQCQSVCNQTGKMRMLSEMYGCTGGSLTFEDREWIAHQQMILGVNLIVPHLSLFSQTGCRKRDFPQNINYQQSWWNLNSHVDVPLARACYAMAQGKYAADILVLHPQESIAMNWHLGTIGKTRAPIPAAARERMFSGTHIPRRPASLPETLQYPALIFSDMLANAPHHTVRYSPDKIQCAHGENDLAAP